MSTTTVKTQSPLDTFAWLLRREFWEYRGSFYWAPLITCLIMLTMMLLGMIAAELFANQHGVTIGAVKLDQITEHMDEAHIEKLRAGIDVGLLTMNLPITLVLFLVSFFYCTGALYNDRADRSVLFWKSLPLSDTQTVLAKVVTAAVVAPLLALAAKIAMHVGFLLLISLYAALHGVNAFGILWSPLHLLSLWLKLLVTIPLGVLWALPTIGWLLLVSSFVRSKPFLWSLLVPIAAGVMVTFSGIARSWGFVSWFWHEIVLRMIFSLFQGSWLDFSSLKGLDHNGGDPSEAIAAIFSMSHMLDVLVSPSLLIGAVAGAAMIAGAIWLRRTRVEAYA